MNVNFDYFNRLTTDMLCQVALSGVSGIQVAPYANIGDVNNKGIELNVNYRNKLNDLKYSVGFNIGSVRNEVKKVGRGEDAYISSATFRALGDLARTEAGHPIASYYGFVTDGIYQSQAEIDSLNLLAQIATGNNRAFFDAGAQPGDIRMKDINNDSLINQDDMTYIGNPHPKFTYGLNLDLEYKMFDLRIFGQGVYGNDIFMATIYYLESGDGYWNLLTTVNDYWEKEGDKTNMPRLGQSQGNLRVSDRYIKNGSFFRLKNIQVGYTIPQSFTNRYGIARFRIYLAGQNLVTFRNYKGFDPEIGFGRNQGVSPNQRGTLDIGIDRGNYPVAKSWSIGLNLSF
ncbi:MAG: hypothetical protein HC906_08335 [Bacteroidales bacterium]|nr:hypothetical protein [Bacteroidales bacterium]